MSASSTTVLANAEIIRWARLSSKYSQGDAIKKIGLSKLTVTRLESIEKGTEEPTISEILKFTKIYKRPFAFFFLPEAPPAIPDMHEKRTGTGRGKDTKGSLGLAISRAYEIQNFISGLAVGMSGSVPQTTVAPTELRHDAEKLARWTREQMKVVNDLDPIIHEPREILENWLVAVEELGIIALQETFSPTDASAFSIGDLTPPILVLCFKDAERRRIFSLFHEVAHILLKQRVICELSTKRVDDEERFCDNFAANFLMPKEKLQLIIQKYGKNNIDLLAEKISKYTGASVESAFLRMVDFKLATMDDYWARKDSWEVGYAEWLRKQKRKKGGPNPNPIGTAVRKNGRIVSSIVSNAFRNGQISRADASYIMRLPAAEIPKFIQRIK